MKYYRCPCCNYYTLNSESPGSDEICPVCYWQDDIVQYNDPEFKGGGNDISLIEAKINYSRIKVIDKKFEKYIREPLEHEIK